MENQINLWVENTETAIWHELNKVDKAGEDKAPAKSISGELKEKPEKFIKKLKMIMWVIQNL